LNTFIAAATSAFLFLAREGEATRRAEAAPP
jgi:hypothetical protein